MRAAPDRPRDRARLNYGERAITLSSLILLAGMAWLYLWRFPMPMPGAQGVASLPYAALTFLMWLVMMVAMMTPAITPVVLMFDLAQRYGSGGSRTRTLAFIGGYFSVWAVFSLGVTGLQMLLVALNWVDAMTVSQRLPLSGTLLLAVGVYQWLPAKTACLAHCRGPVAFLTQRYRPGLGGSWWMGLEHGFYCVGCCWLLMLLLFVGGVMNLLWVAALTVVIGAERLLARGELVRRALGLLLVMAGVGLILRQFTAH
jgi:predicted metal-binding membrane protein